MTTKIIETTYKELSTKNATEMPKPMEKKNAQIPILFYLFATESDYFPYVANAGSK